MPSLAQPPKFGANQITFPQTLGEWVDFTRWLISLWRVAQASIDAQQAQAITPPVPAGFDASEILGASLAFEQHTQPPPRVTSIPSEALPRFIASAAPDVQALLFQALAKPPYPRGSSITLIEDTFGNIGTYPPGQYPNALYYVTDYKVLYVSITASNVWGYLAGTYVAAAGARPVLGAGDSGFLFIANSVTPFSLEEWDGSNWHNVGSDGSVPGGGTGQVALTAHNVLLGEGTAAVGFAAPGTAGFVLTSNGGAADPSFQASGGVANAVAALSAGKKVVGGVVTMALGTAAFPSGLTSITAVIACIAANAGVAESISTFNPGGGGNISLFSSNPTSTQVVYWFAFGA